MKIQQALTLAFAFTSGTIAAPQHNGGNQLAVRDTTAETAFEPICLATGLEFCQKKFPGWPCDDDINIAKDANTKRDTQADEPDATSTSDENEGDDDDTISCAKCKSLISKDFCEAVEKEKSDS